MTQEIKKNYVDNEYKIRVRTRLPHLVIITKNDETPIVVGMSALYDYLKEKEIL